jgi:hypothetical protein
MPLPHINALWIGGDLPRMGQICLVSFLSHGHPVTLYCYDPITNAPSGIEVADAGAIVDRAEIFVNRRGSVASFADLFRWELLYQRGGVWVDCDVFCLRPLDLQDDPLFGLQDAHSVAIGVLGLQRQSTIAKDMITAARSPHRWQPYDSTSTRMQKLVRRFLQGDRMSNVGWGEGGGIATFARYVKYRGLQHLARPPHDLYPLPMHEWRRVLDGSLKPLSRELEGSYTIHLWNEFFRRDNVSTDGPFPPGSFLAEAETMIT